MHCVMTLFAGLLLPLLPLHLDIRLHTNMPLKHLQRTITTDSSAAQHAPSLLYQLLLEAVHFHLPRLHLPQKAVHVSLVFDCCCRKQMKIEGCSAVEGCQGRWIATEAESMKPALASSCMSTPLSVVWGLRAHDNSLSLVPAARMYIVGCLHARAHGGVCRHMPFD